MIHIAWYPTKRLIATSQSLEPERLGFKILILLWYLADGSAAVPSRRLPKFGSMGKLLSPISRHRHFARSYDKISYAILKRMMTLSNGNLFRVTGPLWGESTGHRWIPLAKASDAELWCLLWSVPEQTVEQTLETLVIWDAIAPLWRHLNGPPTGHMPPQRSHWRDALSQ